MVETKKFSEFIDGLDIQNGDITVGLRAGENTKFDNPWNFLNEGSTGDRPTPSATINYRLRFNTTLRQYEYYDAVDLTWVQLAEGVVNVASVQGTLHQVLVNGTTGSPQTGNLILTTPQNIDTTSDVAFRSAVLTVSLSPLYGGTGVANSSGSTLTLGGATRFIGNFAVNFTFSNTTNVTFPTSGTLATVAGTVSSITGTANQVLANGTSGSATTGAVTLTTPQDINTTSNVTFNSLILATPLSMSYGGSGANLSPSNGGIVYSTASAMGILSGTATARQLLLSGASTTPQWSTTTYPLTNAINTIMYASSANVLGSIAAANSSVLVTSSSGVPSMSGAMTNGQLIIGSTGATPTAAALTAGSGITISNGAGSITISSSGSGYSWTEVTGTSQAMAVNNGYVANNALLVTLTLPSTSNFGDSVIVQGKGAGLFKIQAGGGQTIRFGNTSSSAGGSLTAISQYNSLELLNISTGAANTDWAVLTGTQGAFTVV